MFKKQIAKTVALGLIALAAGAANAGVSYNLAVGGAIGNVAFDDFDWADNGAAWVNNFQGGVGPTLGIGSSFDLYYIAKASAVTNLGNTTLSFIGQNVTDGTSLQKGELTIFAHITETITNVGVNASGKAYADFVVTGGRWDIYLDSAANASLVTGTGFQDGARILGGVFVPNVAGTFTNLNGTPGTVGADGSGSNSLKGVVDYTDLAYITPDMTGNGTIATTTLQYGLTAGSWVRPTGFEGLAGYPASDSPASFTLRADANQNFVPEPTSMALLGLGFAALSGIRRRNKA